MDRLHSGRPSRRAIIIGGSLGGLFAAHLLRASGFEVDVFERNVEDLAGRGAGIGTHDALVDVMRRIGVDADNALGIAIDTYLCLDRDGHITHRSRLPRIMSAWSRLYRPLRDALPAASYHAGRALERIDAERDGVTAIFADGSRASGDLLIGADGFRSTVRTQFLPDLRPAYAGYVAWRALAPESEIKPASIDLLFDSNAFCVPDGELLVSYAVPARDGDVRPGYRDYNIVWYRAADARTLADLNTDAAGYQHEQIPPPLIRPDVVAAINATAHALLAPPIAEIFAQARQSFFQPIYDLASPRMVFERAALLGDAAFVARPHIGAGVTKAALDAACLADAIVQYDDIDAALAHYDRERRSFGDWIVERSRDLGKFIGAGPLHRRPSLAEQADFVMQGYLAMPLDVRDWARRSLRRASA